MLGATIIIRRKVQEHRNGRKKNWGYGWQKKRLTVCGKLRRIEAVCDKMGIGLGKEKTGILAHERI